MAKEQCIYGVHAVKSALKRTPNRVLRLCVLTPVPARLEPIVAMADSVCRIEQVHQDQLCKWLPEGARHQGICAWVKEEQKGDSVEALLEKHGDQTVLMLLEGVQDPHNLGACLRTAAAMGVHGVLLSQQKTVGLTPVVHKVASGAVDQLPIMPIGNVASQLRELKKKGVWVYGTSEHAPASLVEAKIVGPQLWVFGNEGDGVRALTQSLCDQLVALPTQPEFPSLNLSVAVGMVLFEVKRRTMLA